MNQKQFETQQAQLRNLVLDLYEKGAETYEIVVVLDEIIDNAMKRAADLGRPLSVDEVKTWYGLHVTTVHHDKMAGMNSISTTCKYNKFCKMYQKIVGAICQKCFSERQQGFQKSMTRPLLFNAILLQNVIIPDELLPMINAFQFRFEAFGDLGNETQYINYCHIAQKNKRTAFALWTKNPFIIARALETGKVSKPGNMIHIVSSLFENVAITWDFIAKKGWTFIDKVFTVYKNQAAADAAGIKINCGKRNCLMCGRCYSFETERNINELEK